MSQLENLALELAEMRRTLKKMRERDRDLNKKYQNAWRETESYAEKVEKKEAELSRHINETY